MRCYQLGISLEKPEDGLLHSLFIIAPGLTMLNGESLQKRSYLYFCMHKSESWAFPRSPHPLAVKTYKEYKD